VLFQNWHCTKQVEGITDYTAHILWSALQFVFWDHE